jgi:hypothetical protein
MRETGVTNSRATKFIREQGNSTTPPRIKAASHADIDRNSVEFLRRSQSAFDEMVQGYRDGLIPIPRFLLQTAACLTSTDSMSLKEVSRVTMRHSLVGKGYLSYRRAFC